MARAALVLAGNGVYDGTEVHEASACLLHLSSAGAQVKIYAPDVPQMHTVDHTRGSEIKGDNRNVKIESARISRGDIFSLEKLKGEDHDLLVVPGGFGVAKHLSTWVSSRAGCEILPEFERVIKEFHGNKKPIALCCLAPVLVAKAIPGCEVTIGNVTPAFDWPYRDNIEGVEKCGAKHVMKEVDEIHVDEANKLVTTPAFMYRNATEGWFALHRIHEGISKMITEALRLCN